MVNSFVLKTWIQKVETRTVVAGLRFEMQHFRVIKTKKMDVTSVASPTFDILTSCGKSFLLFQRRWEN